MDYLKKMPDKILDNVLDNLPYKDVLNCKLLNKHFHRIVADYSCNSLVISHRRMPANRKWFKSFELVDPTNQLKTKDYSYVKFNYPIFKRIKQLLIISTDFSNYEKYNLIKLFEQVNLLSEHLEHLELVGLKMEKSNHVILNLPKLINLNVERCEIACITLNTPILTNLRVELYESFSDKLIFACPQSIKLIETNYYDTCITKFVKLEYLYVAQKLCLNDLKTTDEAGNEVDEFLSKLNSLKELQFFTERQTFAYLCKQKEALKRNDLRIYYCGVDLVDNDLDSVPNSDRVPYIWLDERSIGFYMKHYSNTATFLPFVRRFSFDYDMEEYFHYLPHRLIKFLMNKFVNLKSIEIAVPIRDVDKFIAVMQLIDGLRCLKFYNSDLNQQFFDNLPIYQPVLEELRVDEQGKEINFKFVLDFKVLNCIHISKNLEHEFVCEVIGKFGEIRLFFMLEDVEVSLEAEENLFEFCALEEKSVQFESLDGLLAYLSSVDLKALYDEHAMDDLLDSFDSCDDLESSESEEFIQ